MHEIQALKKVGATRSTKNASFLSRPNDKQTNQANQNSTLCKIDRLIFVTSYFSVQ